MSAPLRITQPAVSVTAEAVGAPPSERGADFQGYLDRLMKMIPGEAVGLYLVGSGFIPAAQSLVLLIWSIICLAGVIAIKAYGTADRANQIPPDWVHVGISSVAFVIWLYSIGGPFGTYGVNVPYIGSLLVLAWTFFVPIFYKGPAD
jgi:hypothetical protein